MKNTISLFNYFVRLDCLLDLMYLFHRINFHSHLQNNSHTYITSLLQCMRTVWQITSPISMTGGSFAYLRVELGDFMAFIGAGNILLEYVIGGAAVARSWTSYFATLCNHKPNDFRIHASSLQENYNELDPIAVFVIIVICLISVYSTKVWINL